MVVGRRWATGCGQGEHERRKVEKGRMRGSGWLVGEDNPDDGHTRQRRFFFFNKGHVAKESCYCIRKKEQTRKNSHMCNLQQRIYCNCNNTLVLKESCYDRLEKKSSLAKIVIVQFATNVLLQLQADSTHHISDDSRCG